MYEPGAVMLDEEAAVIGGLLVGLNVIDCNLGIKDEDLDQPVRICICNVIKTHGQLKNLPSSRNTIYSVQCFANLKE